MIACFLGGAWVRNDHVNEIRRINYLTSESKAIYHLSSLKLGISDSVSMVLYAIYVNGEACLLSDIYKSFGISKQTINSAIRSLEADGVLYLEQHTGRSKMVVLTDKGKAFVQTTVARLYQAELGALDSWTEDEISTYLRLMEKYNDCFRQQIEKL